MSQKTIIKINIITIIVTSPCHDSILPVSGNNVNIILFLKKLGTYWTCENLCVFNKKIHQSLFAAIVLNKFPLARCPGISLVNTSSGISL